jgi:N6-L-threonylcarbamoyladenine synthase
MAALAEERGLTLAFPPVSLCTDNAAMIASVADRMLAAGQTAHLGLEAFSRIPLESLGEGSA